MPYEAERSPKRLSARCAVNFASILATELATPSESVSNSTIANTS
jgi:hypothetical protein